MLFVVVCANLWPAGVEVCSRVCVRAMECVRLIVQVWIMFDIFLDVQFFPLCCYYFYAGFLTIMISFIRRILLTQFVDVLFLPF